LVKGVRHSKSGKMYANKIQNKSRMKAGRATQLAIEEHKCLSTTESKFVVSLVYAYHDPENVYLVLELLTGGDLHFHLKKHKKFTDDVATYFLAATIQGIGALHDAGFCLWTGVVP
jgi:serine/threonine protein kinase